MLEAEGEYEHYGKSGMCCGYVVVMSTLYSVVVSIWL